MSAAVKYIRVVADFGGKKRNLYKDEESTRLAGRHTNGYTNTERTVENVRNHLKAALAALENLSGSTVPLKQMKQAVDLSEALSEVEHFLPEVEAWCVYRTPDAEDRWARIYCGCLTEAHAKRVLIAVKKYEETQEKAHPWWGEADKQSTRLVVKLMPCRIHDMLKPTVTGEQFTKGWGRS